MQVTGLNIHPLKSGRAIPVEAATVRLDGFRGDRRFMVVEPEGRFITQRELQALARVEAHEIAGGVRLVMEGREVAAAFDPSRRLDVTVWESTVSAAVADDAVNAALSQWFARPVRLVHMDARSERAVGAEWAGRPAPVGFADGFPILVDCDEPWAEDFWEVVEIGGIVFDFVKPCARCIMVTQDQTTGERTGGNPIQGLAEKRMSADRRVPGVLFGWNAVPRGEGEVRLGDAVEVIATRAGRWPMKVR